MVVQVSLSEIACVLVRDSGAAARTAGTSDWIARTSSQVIVGCEPMPPRMPPELLDPENSRITFVPDASIIERMRSLAPSPIDTMQITAATPMMMPRAVRLERSVLRRRASSASRRVSPKEIMRRPPAAGR